MQKRGEATTSSLCRGSLVQRAEDLAHVPSRTSSDNNKQEEEAICTKSYNPKHLVAETKVSIGNNSASDKNNAWNTFDDYISAGLPVKIEDYSCFNTRIRSNGGKRWGEGKQHRDLSDLLQSIPTEAMDSTVTVQCLPSTTIAEAISSRKRKRVKHTYTAQEMDDLLSLASRHSDDVPLFMGQDDQLSAQMKLGDVFRGSCASLNSTNDGVSVVSSYPHICVAQESILSTSSSASTEHNGDDDHDEVQISCQDDGSVCYMIYDNQCNAVTNDKMRRPRDDSFCALASLSDGVVAPSSLLPNDKICLHNINFWYAPKPSMTNWHHDGHSNILTVVNGMKTVELAPPGAIKASAICSDHANHPSLLRHSCSGASKAYLDDELQKTRINLEASRMIVTIARGDALFIPEGWWHRVESSAETMAVNFWFDRRESSIFSLVRPSNKHMLPFQLRELARIYFTEHFADAVASWMKSSVVQIRQRMEFTCNDKNEYVFDDNLQKFDNFVGTLKRGVDKLLDVFDHDDNSKLVEARAANIARHLEYILFQTEVKSKTHCGYVKKLFGECFGESTATGDMSKRQAVFCKAMMNLSMGACFNILELWDYECSFNFQNENISPSLFLQFVDLCGIRANKVVDHLKAEHSRFKLMIAQKLIINDLMVDHIRDAMF